MAQEINEKRKLYNGLVRFTENMEGNVVIAAKDEAHARELIVEYMKNKINLVIIDVFPMDSVDKPIDFMQDTDFREKEIKTLN